MQTRSLGPGASEVPVVGFGGMPLSITGRPGETTGISVIHAALDSGMTLIDTADVYCFDDGDIGHNERLIAKALRSWPGDRNRVIVATKGGLTRPSGSWEQSARPDRLKLACERSLAALAVERIDLYQLHAPDPSVPFADSVGALADLQREGKIRWVGLSNASVEEILEAGEILPVVSVQNRLNPFFREAIAEGVVAHCGRNGIGFLAYSPLGGGQLNQKLPGHPVPSGIAKKRGLSAHAVVLAWVLAQGPSVIVIPGARTPEHARDSATAAALALDPEELDAIDRAEFSRA